ncbi:hypothetical protein [Mycobacterium intracellulare]|uniref:hypothetical protein n=1 Tax=Mycobacterium intracellulare TaxID=1767 RepID=UPI00259270DF|nr:hypothetical protein [Mycobacterium intracellulare]MDM3894731.1 hypothetical protein [Mycobacterium intracellulare]
MPILNELPERSLLSVNRMLAWLLIIGGYLIAIGMAVDSAGWDDPVFRVVKLVPFAPYSWAATLALAVTIYTAGEVISVRSRRRGVILITGATMCTAWSLAVAIAMSRMVYVMPDRITLLWPLVMTIIACLYASRAIVYADAFTGDRWNTNPYQLWTLTFVMSASLGGIIIGVAPGSLFTEVEKPVALQLALVNFIGAAVIMYGLHLRNSRLGEGLELAGGFSLVLTLSWYCANVLHQQMLAGTTLGFAAIEAATCASLHRSIQIMTKKLAEQRGNQGLADRMGAALHNEQRAAIDPVGEAVVGRHRHGRS